MHHVVLLQEELRLIAAVLAGDTGIRAVLAAVGVMEACSGMVWLNRGCQTVSTDA
jgi:hypothetical protein